MVVKSPGNQQPHIGLLLGLPQQHSDLLPAITDGSIGDMLYFHNYKRPGVVTVDGRSVEKASKTSKKMAIGRIIFSRHGLIINGYII